MALPKIDVLVLSSLAKGPMHGYEIKQELRFKHVRWWAKAEHGHLYASLARLERKGHATAAEEVVEGRRRKVYTITTEGRVALDQALESIALGADTTYFDIDLFVSSSFLLERARVLALLERRRETLRTQLSEAEALQARVPARTPASARLIIEHRIGHLERELAFARKALNTFRGQDHWGSAMGGQSVDAFVAATGAPLES